MLQRLLGQLVMLDLVKNVVVVNASLMVNVVGYHLTLNISDWLLADLITRRDALVAPVRLDVRDAQGRVIKGVVLIIY